MTESLGHRLLPTGTKILWDRSSSGRVASLGFFFPFGSRDDPPGKGGTAHFVEHFLFKGTQSHSAATLAREIDRVGGDLNAYTDRCEMGFTCTVPAEFWQIGLEVLIELCFKATFPVEEFEKEKKVILSEIQAVDDDPEEASYETFLSLLSPEHPELRPVAGTLSSLPSLEREEVQRWATEHLHPAFLTFSWAGPLDPQGVLSVFEKSLKGNYPANIVRPRYLPIRTNPFVQTYRAPSQMIQIVLGFHRDIAPDWMETLFLQTLSLLWGETMGSRLFQRLREELGLCYSVTSQVWETDEGMGLHSFVSVLPEQTNETLNALHSLVLELVRQPPTKQEWEEARQSFRGGLIVGAERMENRMQRLFSLWNRWGRLISLEDVLNDLSNLKFAPHWDVWAKYFRPETGSLLVWGKTSQRLLSSGKSLWK